VRLKYPHVEKSLLPPKKIFGKMVPAFIDKRRSVHFHRQNWCYYSD